MSRKIENKKHLTPVHKMFKNSESGLSGFIFEKSIFRVKCFCRNVKQKNVKALCTPSLQCVYIFLLFFLYILLIIKDKIYKPLNPEYSENHLTLIHENILHYRQNFKKSYTRMYW